MELQSVTQKRLANLGPAMQKVADAFLDDVGEVIVNGPHGREKYQIVARKLAELRAVLTLMELELRWQSDEDAEKLQERL